MTSAARLHEDSGIRTGETAAQNGEGTCVLVNLDNINLKTVRVHILPNSRLEGLDRIFRSKLYERFYDIESFVKEYIISGVVSICPFAILLGLLFAVFEECLYDDRCDMYSCRNCGDWHV